MNTTQTGLVRHLRSLVARQTTGVLSDQQLLESFLTQRSESSFAALVRRHGPMVMGVCHRVLRHTQDAEDAFQATFLLLARKADSIRKRESVGSFLHGVAYFMAERLKAKAARRSVHERRVIGRPPRDSMEEITWRELRAVLDEELAHLPEQYRGPLVLCYLEGKTQDEAARQLNWSKGTFRRRLEQGRRALGRRLTRRGLALSAALSAPLLADATAQALVPPVLGETTVQAGLALATGQEITGLVSAPVATLAGAGGKTLLAAKTKTVFALLMALGLAIGGTFTYGALAARPAAAPPPPPAKAPMRRADAGIADKDRAVEIKGLVFDSEGKPLAGARVFLLSDAVKIKPGAPALATTDKDGRFGFTARRDELEQGGKVVVTAKDHGPDWRELTDPKKASEITLRLVPDDVPINGRVLDLEGRPVAGVRVRAISLKRGDLKAWFDGTLAHRYPQLPERISPEVLGESVTAITGKDGRFRLSGFGRDRVVHVLLDGDNIERGDFEVVTRLEIPRGLSKGKNGVYPARFDHLAGPGKSILGTVRDKRTGKPIAGITVANPSSPSWVWATTDEQGHYRLNGIGKRQEYWVAAGGLPYFNCTKMHIGDTPGMEPIPVDFALEKGIVVRGKLLDKVTGKPIRGYVSYMQLPDNPNLKDFQDVGKPQVIVSNTGQTKADGSFAVVAVPGPGMLGAKAFDDGHYLAAPLPEPRPKGSFILEDYHAVVLIDPSEQDAESTTRDITLQPGQTRKGTVVGPDGKPLAGAHFAGLSSTVQLHFGRTETMETASFTAGGLDPKGSRNLVFIHAAKKLAKVQKVHGADKGPLTVCLEPLGTLAGRLLDADGRPRAGLQVAVMLSVEREDYKDLPLELLFDYPAWSKVLNREATTDAEGRFRVEGLVPGLKYLINVKDDGAIVKSLTRTVDAIESGKTKDLGDLKSK